MLTVSQVLHRFAEHEIVHQFVKVTLEIALFFLPEFSVHPNVWLHQAFLFKLDRSVHLFQTHPLFEIKLQVLLVDHVICFVLQRQLYLLAFRRV